MNTPAQLPKAVFLVDDDDSVLNSLGCMLTVSGMRVDKYAAGDAFTARIENELAHHRSAAGWPHQPCCVVLDINMPRLSGTGVFEYMLERDLTRKVPVIFMTGHGDVALAVSLVKAGAFHFLEKPVEPDRLVEVIGVALDASAAALQQAKEDEEEKERWNELTPREKDVMLLAKKGLTNQEISEQLSISLATTKSHRISARNKLGIRSVVDLHQRPAGFWGQSSFGHDPK